MNLNGAVAVAAACAATCQPRRCDAEASEVVPCPRGSQGHPPTGGGSDRTDIRRQRASGKDKHIERA